MRARLINVKMAQGVGSDVTSLFEPPLGVVWALRDPDFGRNLRLDEKAHRIWPG